MLKPLFYTRTFAYNPFQADTWLSVTAARWKTPGGPDTAQLAGVSAGRLDLPQALQLLRCPVVLVDGPGIPAWWGYVSAVEFHQNGITVRADLETIANRVKATYIASPLETNQWTSQSAESAWYEDLDSQAAYGIKENVIHLYDSTPIQAVAACGVALAESAWPVAYPTPGADAGSPDVILTLRGWWHTLGWKYYDNPDGLIQNTYEGPGSQFVGGATGDQNIYQSFTVANAGWLANQVWLKAALRGYPTDSLQVDICQQDVFGAPGTSLASATLSHTFFTNTFAWLCFDFASPPALSAGVNWLWVHRTGSNHATHKYILKVDDFESYSDGECWVNSAPRATPTDLLFRIAGGIDTAEQIEAMAGPTAGGQFLAGVLVGAPSGIYTNPYRTGSLTALAEILAHLKAGNSTGVRLAAEITVDRLFRLSVQPDPAAAALYITSAGIIANQAAIPVPPYTPAAGRWAVVSGAWGEAGSPYQHVKDRVLLETVEYDPAIGGLRVGF